MRKRVNRDTYGSLLGELLAIPEKDTLESPILDFILGVIEEAKDPEVENPGFIIVTMFYKRLDPTLEVVVDSYLTGKEVGRITNVLFWTTNHYAEVRDDVKDEERIRMNIDLLEALFKSWRSLGTSEYNERVLKFLDVSPNNEATPEDLTWMFEILKKPLDFESTKRRRIMEIMEDNEENVKMFHHCLDDDQMFRKLGKAIGKEEKLKIIKGIKELFKEEKEEVVKENKTSSPTVLSWKEEREKIKKYLAEETEGAEKSFADFLLKNPEKLEKFLDLVQNKLAQKRIVEGFKERDVLVIKKLMKEGV